MSGAEATGGVGGPAGGGVPAALTPAAIDAVLGDFRAWLTDLAQRSEDGEQRSEGERPGSGLLTSDLRPLTSQVDLFTLVGQFTALRHEVNMQTRAARAATEQTAEVLKHLAANSAEAKSADTSDEHLRPLAKAVIDVADALTLSLRQMEKLREAAEPLLDDLAEPPAEPPPGFFARLFRTRPAAAVPAPRQKQAADKLGQLATAAADGYAMSLRRVERVLPTFGLEPIPCKDEPFDPERMEVVEVVADSGRPAGTVVDEVRPGYRWRGKVFRFAQVKVAR